MKMIATIAASLIAGFAATAANAQPVNSVRIFYGDLNLNAHSGLAMFEARVRRAANAVCGSPRGVDFASRSESAECRRTAIDNAMAAVPTRRGQEIASR